MGKFTIHFEFEIWGLYNGRFEFGFLVYSSLIKTLFENYHIWIFINTFIDLAVLYLIFKRYSSSIILSFLFFVVYMGLTIEFNLFRNSKSIILFLLSIKYLLMRKSFPYFFLNILGCTLHLSAFIFCHYILFWLNGCRKLFYGWFFFLLIICFFGGAL